MRVCSFTMCLPFSYLVALMAAAVIGAAVILLGRHHFDPRDAQEVSERRFYELTHVGFTAAPRTGPGQVPQIRSFDPNAEETMFFPMLRFRPSRPGERSRRGPQGPSLSDTASRELRKADPCGCCGSGCRRLNGRSSRKRAISRSSAATPQNCTGSMREPRRTSARSTKTTVRRSGYVFCRWAICRCEAGSS